MLRVRDLVAEGDLRLEVVGDGAGLDRAVASAHVSELLDPTPWLQGGELLMTTGMALPGGRPAVRAYVDRLAGAGVAALAFGLGEGLRHREVPAALVRAAEDLGLAVLRVPEGTPFLAVTKRVFARLAAEEYAAVARASDAQRALTAAAVRPGGVAGLAAALAASTGLEVAVCDRARGVLAAEPARAQRHVGPVARELSRLATAGVRASATVSGPDGTTQVQVLGVDEPLGFLVCAGGTAPAAGERLVVASAVSLLTLELEGRRARAREAERRRGVLLARLLAGPTTPERAAELVADMGLASAALVRVAEVAADAATVASLRDAVPRAVLLDEGPGTTLLCPDPAEDLADRLAALLDGTDARVGLGLGVPVEQAALSRQQARRALTVARRRGVPVADASLLGTAQLLLALGDATALRAHAEVVLAPLRAADPRGELERSLRAYLEANGAWEVAAAVLDVHRHTLRHRMARVEQLTGRRLHAVEDRVELYLALEVLAEA